MTREVASQSHLGNFPIHSVTLVSKGAGTWGKGPGPSLYIAYFKCLRSQTSLIKPITPAERKSFHFPSRVVEFICANRSCHRERRCILKEEMHGEPAQLSARPLCLAEGTLEVSRTI